MSHGFPSQSEAKVYCAAAGVSFPQLGVPMETPELKSLRDGVEETYALFWPTPTDGVPEGTPGALAYVVCKRRGGLLLALPLEVFSREELEATSDVDAEAPLGPHVVMKVPGIRDEGLGASPAGIDLDVLVVDVSEKVLPGLFKFADAGLNEDLLIGFHSDSSVVPDLVMLQTMVTDWLGGTVSQRVAFYSAESEEMIETPKSTAKAKVASKAKGGGEKAAGHAGPTPKRGSQSTPKAVAEQIKNISDLLPCAPSKAQSDASDYACPGLCEIDGEPSKNKAVAYESSSSSHKRCSGRAEDEFGLEPGGARTGRGSGDSHSIRSSGDGGVGAVSSLNDPGSPSSSRRSSARLPGYVIGQFFKRGGRQRKASERVGKPLWRIHAVGGAEHVQTAETGIPVPVDFGGDRELGCFHASVPREVRRIWKLQGHGNSAVRPVVHHGHGDQRRPGRSSGTCGSFGGGSGSIRPGPRSLGFRVPTPVVGRPTTCHVELQEPGFSSHREDKGILTTMPTTMGNDKFGIYKGNRLYPQQENRDGKEGWSTSSPSNFRPGSQEKAEVAKRKGEWKCKVGRGGDRSMREDATPLPSLSRSERTIALCDGTASGGRGGNFPECFDELCEVAEDYEENDSQQQRLSKYGLAVGLASWPVEVLRNILNSGGTFVHRCIQGCRGVRSSAAPEALFPIPLPLDDVWGRNPNGLGKERRLRLAYRRMVHLCVMALNFMHSRQPFSDLPAIWRCPGPKHVLVHSRLLALCRASGPTEEVSILGCGRKSFQLSARYHELLQAVQSYGLDEKGSYTKKQDNVKVPLNNQDVEELVPYRPLQADRLKISGT